MEFDAQTASWVTRATMPWPKHGPQGAYAAGMAVVVGGASATNAGTSQVQALPDVDYPPVFVFHKN